MKSNFNDILLLLIAWLGVSLDLVSDYIQIVGGIVVILVGIFKIIDYIRQWKT
ncbi:MAG: hypothetical protein GDA51_09555 [Ekhidna sp.]|nr:hypothetical protein [Ekhidna sp.]MBC6409623.1 hypothetical protein [Ekhidna sp.]MBC6426692.1 hypothetical protein [Ekhidna sp.]